MSVIAGIFNHLAHNPKKWIAVVLATSLPFVFVTQTGLFPDQRMDLALKLGEGVFGNPPLPAENRPGHHKAPTAAEVALQGIIDSSASREAMFKVISSPEASAELRGIISVPVADGFVKEFNAASDKQQAVATMLGSPAGKKALADILAAKPKPHGDLASIMASPDGKALIAMGKNYLSQAQAQPSATASSRPAPSGPPTLGTPRAKL